jgi:hypothetical protein
MVADCDTDHWLAVAKVREKLAVSKQTTQSVHIERFNRKKLNEIEGKDQYRVEISNRFAVLGILGTDVVINRAWEIIREEIKVSAKESLGYFISHVSMKDAQNYYLKGNNPDPSEINGDNLNNIRHETSRHFRSKKREYTFQQLNYTCT